MVDSFHSPCINLILKGKICSFRNSWIKIYGDNKKECIIFSTDSLAYIKSQGNYACFYIYNNKKLEEQVLRNTLGNITNDLKQYPNFIRCHKSYIVNIQKIKIINSTKLMLEDGTWLNLSRTYKPILKEILHKE